jgi:hypothetical protein
MQNKESFSSYQNIMFVLCSISFCACFLCAEHGTNALTTIKWLFTPKHLSLVVTSSIGYRVSVLPVVCQTWYISWNLGSSHHGTFLWFGPTLDHARFMVTKVCYVFPEMSFTVAASEACGSPSQRHVLHFWCVVMSSIAIPTGRSLADCIMFMFLFFLSVTLNVWGSLMTFVTNLFFYDEGLLAPRPNPKLEDHPLLFVCGCLLNVFSAILHSWSPFFIHNPRMRHTVVTGNPHNLGGWIILGWIS